MFKFIVSVAILATVNADLTLICKGKRDGVFIRDYSSCKSYYSCINETPYKGECPGDFLFNPVTLICDYPKAVECKECPRVGSTTFPLLGDSCSKYIKCSSGVAVYEECPGNLVYDANRGVCNAAENVDCMATMCPAHDDQSIRVASNERCDLYFECQNGKPVEKECQVGLHFSATKKLCDRPELANCPIKGPNVETVDDIEIDCPPTGLYRYPHPASCSHYFLCVNGINVLQTCGDVLQYDYKSEQCKTNAKCITDSI